MIRGGAKDIMLAAIPATIGGFVIGFVDSKFLGAAGTVARTLGKLVTAFVVGSLGKRWGLGQTGAGIAMGAILGTIGHEFGVKAGGGMIAMTKKEGVSELIAGAAYDAEVQAELGALIEDGELEGSVADGYQADLMGGGKNPYAAALEGEDDMGEEDSY
jgi:hypothetical protein